MGSWLSGNFGRERLVERSGIDDSKFTREILMDQCPKTFCYSDRISNNAPLYQIKQRKESSLQFLNEIFERGSLNQNFNFISGMNQVDVKPFEPFFQASYLQKAPFKPSKPNSRESTGNEASVQCPLLEQLRVFPVQHAHGRNLQ